jgi:hypothetical protein
MSANGTPMDIARRYFTAFENREWDVLATMFDPAEQARFHGMQVNILCAWLQYPPDGNRGLVLGMTGAGDKPDPEILGRFADTLIHAFRGSPTLGQLAAMSPQVFLVEWFAARYGGPEASSAVGFGRGPSVPRKVLGAVIEGDALAHVVYRADSPAAADWRVPWRVSVLSLRRGSDGRWLVLPDDHLVFGPGIMRSLSNPSGKRP